MPLKLANLAASKLAAPLTDAALIVQLEDGSTFPELIASGDWFPVAVVNDMAQTEFMRAIGRTGNVLQVLRAQEGSIARAYDVGDVVELRLTVAALEEIRSVGME